MVCCPYFAMYLAVPVFPELPPIFWPPHKVHGIQYCSDVSKCDLGTSTFFAVAAVVKHVPAPNYRRK